MKPTVVVLNPIPGRHVFGSEALPISVLHPSKVRGNLLADYYYVVSFARLYIFDNPYKETFFFFFNYNHDSTQSGKSSI